MNMFAKIKIAAAQQQFKLRSWVSIERGQDESEWIMLDSHSGAICACNDTAGVLLAELQGGASMEQLALALHSEFDVSNNEAHQAALQFLQQLSSMGAVYEED